MQIFLDSAHLPEIQAAKAMGLIDGITTNPSLVAKSGQPFLPLVKEICHVVQGPVSAECLATDYEAMLTEAKQLAAIDKHVVVKLPLTADGLRCCKTLSGMGIATNVTLCFSTGQGLLAAKAGATYVSPFIGRLDDTGQDGSELIRELADVYRAQGYKTTILAASIRHPRHVIDAALAGAGAMTAPWKIIQQLLRHPLTELGLQQFLADAKQAQLAIT